MPALASRAFRVRCNASGTLRSESSLTCAKHPFMFTTCQPESPPQGVIKLLSTTQALQSLARFHKPIFRLSAGFAVQRLVLDDYMQLGPSLVLFHAHPHLVYIASG